MLHTHLVKAFTNTVGVYNILQAKIAKLVDDNKDIIITRASEIAAKRIEKNINLRTVLALLTANREKQ